LIDRPRLLITSLIPGASLANMKGRAMKWFTILILAIVIALTILAALPFASGHAEDEASPIFGMKIPAGYRDWRLIFVAHEEGNLNDLRAILGNDVAIRAAREGKLPFPDGTIIARLAWSYDPLEDSGKAFGHPSIFRGRATQERDSVYGQGLQQIRPDQRLGLRSI
jgi:Cytochrome P460